MKFYINNMNMMKAEIISAIPKMIIPNPIQTTNLEMILDLTAEAGKETITGGTINSSTIKVIDLTNLVAILK